MTGQWYEYNDSKVRAIDQKKQLITDAAYVLFYQLNKWYK